MMWFFIGLLLLFAVMNGYHIFTLYEMVRRLEDKMKLHAPKFIRKERE